MSRRIWPAILAFAFFSFVAPVTFAQAVSSVKEAAPVNPHASPEARALLQYLYSISGKNTITGQHNYPNHGARWTDRAYDLTGKYPGLYGQDFGFSAADDKDSIESRPAMIEEVKRQYANGAVIALTWHEVRPSDDEPVTFTDSVQGHLTDFEWQELLTPGTDLNKRWCAQVDVIAGYLKQLRDAHVPVLYRPYHEINGNWFWWDGRPGKDGSAALYRQLYDRFVNYHHLDNLVWIWNANAPSPNAPTLAEYYPGSQFADVLTLDVYGEFKQADYNDMVTLAAGKPVALGEVGILPTDEVLKQQPKWAYFMIWSEFVEASPLPQLNAVFNDSRQLNRGDAGLAGPMAAIRQATAERNPEGAVGDPVTPRATAEAKTLLTRLYNASGKSVLSGQGNTPNAVNASTNAVVQATSKQPAIYGEDFGTAKETESEAAATRQAIVDEAKRQAKAHAVVSLTWHATRPGEQEAGSAEKGQLSDFEWNELLTPGTRLYEAWCAQVDSVAKSLKQLQDAGVPVLWQPYPELNSKTFWWSGRKGSHGSAALYRQLFDRLVTHDGVRNLVWVWNATPGNGPGAAGSYDDFFPGLLYVDALSVDLNSGGSRRPMDQQLARVGAGKVIGIGLTGKIPPPAAFGEKTKWSFFLVTPMDATAASASDQGEALKELYGNSRVVSLPMIALK